MAFLFLFFGTTLCNTLSIGCTYLYKFIIDGLVDNSGLNGIINYLILWAVVLIINTFLTYYVYDYYFSILKIKISNDLRYELFKSMICSPFIFFKKNNANTLLVKILDDTRQIGHRVCRLWVSG